MSKELGRFLERESIDAGAWWLTIGDGWLKPEGVKHYYNFIRLIKNNEKTEISEHIRILDGYDYTSKITGLANLEPFKGKNALVIGNHSNTGPIGGYGELILTSHYIKQETGKDPKWARGRGNNPLQERMRKRLDQTLGTIPIDEENKGAFLFRSALKSGKTVGLYAEGGSFRTLHKANPNAGGFMLIAAEMNIPIFCAATWFQNDTFFLTFTGPLSIEMIKRRGSSLGDKIVRRQTIADYAMSTIAQHSPENRRGYYQNYQGIVSQFESLV